MNISFPKINLRQILIVTVPIVVIAGGYFAAKSLKTETTIDVQALGSLSDEIDEWTNFINMNSLLEAPTEQQVDTWLSEGKFLFGEYQHFAQAYVSMIRKLEIDNSEEVQKVLELYDLFGDDNATEAKVCADKQAREELISDSISKVPIALSRKQQEIYASFIENLCESSLLLDKVDIVQKTETLKAEYQEEQNRNIPFGFTIAATSPADGTSKNVTISLEGKVLGTSTVTTKEVVNGVNYAGSGESEEVAREINVVLEGLLDLFQTQTLNVSTLVHYLDEANWSKASEWESKYKKVLFNWRRFDDYQILPSQATFKEVSTYSSSDFPLQINLPIQVKYYQGKSTPEIPLFFHAKNNAWMSTNKTISALFEIISNQKIEAVAGQKQIEYAKTDDCRYYAGEKYDVDEFAIEGYDELDTNFSSEITLVADAREMSKSISRGDKIASDLAFVDAVNSSKITVFTVKKYEYYGCELSSDNTYTFFADEN